MPSSLFSHVELCRVAIDKCQNGEAIAVPYVPSEQHHSFERSTINGETVLASTIIYCVWRSSRHYNGDLRHLTSNAFEFVLFVFFLLLKLCCLLLLLNKVVQFWRIKTALQNRARAFAQPIVTNNG